MARRWSVQKWPSVSSSVRNASPCCQSLVVTLCTSTVTFMQVFMINLQRRADRRERMLGALYEQGIACKVTAAVDGK